VEKSAKDAYNPLSIAVIYGVGRKILNAAIEKKEIEKFLDHRSAPKSNVFASETSHPRNISHKNRLQFLDLCCGQTDRQTDRQNNT